MSRLALPRGGSATLARVALACGLLACAGVLPADAQSIGSSSGGLMRRQSAASLGALQAAGGNASGTVVLPASPHASNSRTQGAHAADRVSVSDYAPNGQGVGGAQIMTVLQPQATTDSVVMVQSVGGLNPGDLVTSPLLPSGTVITGVGGGAGASLPETTAAVTQTDAEIAANTPSIGMASALQFAGVFAVPAGAAISGANVPQGAVVASVAYPAGGGTTVYMNTDATADIAAGAVITFSGYTTVPVYLSSKWNAAIPAGAQIGIAAQDDWLAFQNAVFWLAPERGGPGGTVWVPPGVYYLSNNVSTYNGVGFEFADGVSFAPGSGAIDAMPSGLSSYSGTTLASGARNGFSSGLAVSQAFFQQQAKTSQAQGLMITQNNINCANDGGGLGCGMVGAEIQQAIAANLTRGIVWGYHVTDSIQPGQLVSWAGAELELRNNSGIDRKWDSLPGNHVGLHIDNLGNTDNTVVLLPGASGAGLWHRALDCGVAAIRDYCWTVQTGPIAADGTPTMLATLDMGGNLMVQTQRAQGSVLSNPSATGYTVQPTDCGTTLEPLPPAAMTITVPSGLANGCKIGVNEVNTLPITFAAGAGMTMRALNNASKISGNYGHADITVDGGGSFLLSGNIQ